MIHLTKWPEGHTHAFLAYPLIALPRSYIFRKSLSIKLKPYQFKFKLWERQKRSWYMKRCLCVEINLFRNRCRNNIYLWCWNKGWSCCGHMRSGFSCSTQVNCLILASVSFNLALQNKLLKGLCLQKTAIMKCGKCNHHLCFSRNFNVKSCTFSKIKWCDIWSKNRVCTYSKNTLLFN